VTPVSVDPYLQRAGDQFVYEVVLENIGNEAVRIPWSPEGHLFSKRMENATLATISISSLSNPEPITSAILYGAEPVLGSLLKLDPGDKARVRAPGVWRSLSESPGTGSVEAASARIVAVVMVYSRQENLGPIRSQNIVEVGVQQ
jgi:hypothetical protein